MFNGQSPLCKGITARGERCSIAVPAGVEWCWSHDPAHADQRSAIAAKAGKSKSNNEIIALKRGLRELRTAVLEEKVDARVGTCVVQISNSILRALEAERKIRETEEFGERLDRLEGVVTRQKTYRS